MSSAIAHALAVLSWMELPEDDRPPERIWLDDDALNRHFERVSERYRSGSSGGGPEWEDIPELEQNELTSMFRR